MNPRLLWINVQGLDPDGVASRLIYLPTLRRLLRRGSMGFLELGSVADPDIAESVLALKRKESELPWRRGLALSVRPDTLLPPLFASAPSLVCLTRGRGATGLPGHIDIPPNDPSVSSFEAIDAALATARELEPHLIYAELGDGLAALHGRPDESLAFDTQLERLVDGVPPSVPVLLTSTISLRPYLRRLSLLPHVGSIPGVSSLRATGGQALLEVEDEAAADRAEAALFDIQLPDGTGLIADIERYRAGRMIHLRIHPLPGCGLSLESDGDDDGVHLLSEYGLVLLSGPGVRTGALMSLPTRELLDAVSSITFDEAEQGAFAPYLGAPLGADLATPFYTRQAELSL